MRQASAWKVTTRVDLFDRSYKDLRSSRSIREAAKEALQDVVGPTKVEPVLGGYLMTCRGVSETSSDNENDFLEAARRLASKFRM
jgi:hypothetical protein